MLLGLCRGRPGGHWGGGRGSSRFGEGLVLLGLGCAAGADLAVGWPHAVGAGEVLRVKWGLGRLNAAEGGSSPRSWGAVTARIGLCFFVGAPLGWWGELWIWGGPVLGVWGEVSAILLGLGACLSRLGLQSSPEGEQAVVGVAGKAEAVCMRAGIKGRSACSEVWTVF